MKLFNLTDVPTKRLDNANLTEQSFFINGELLKPGESMEVTKSLGELHYDGLEHLAQVGAVFLGDEPPAEYTASKGAVPAAKEPAPTPTKSSSKFPSKFPSADAVAAAGDEPKKEG